MAAQKSQSSQQARASRLPPSQRWMAESIQDDLPATSPRGRYVDIVALSMMVGGLLGIATNPDHPIKLLIFGAAFGLAIFWVTRAIDQLLGRSVWNWYRYMMAGNGRHEDIYPRQLSAVRFRLVDRQLVFVTAATFFALLPVQLHAPARSWRFFGWLVALMVVLLIERVVANAAIDRALVVRWPAHDELERALANEQQRTQDAVDGSIRAKPTLDQLEVLRVVALTDASLDRQLVRLGLRPTLLPPRKQQGKQEIPEEFDSAAQKADTELGGVLRHLIAMGLLRFDGAQLLVTAEGREALALPASVFASRVPVDVHAKLADAQMRLSAGDLAGSANHTGAALERFLKYVVRDFFPHEKVKDVTQRAKMGALDTLTLGDLCELFSLCLGVTPSRLPRLSEGADESREEFERKWQAFVDAKRRDRRLMSQLELHRECLLRMLEVATAHRNFLSHDNERAPVAAVPLAEAMERVSRTYSLLQLARAVVSTYYEVSRLPTEARPGAEEERREGAA